MDKTYVGDNASAVETSPKFEPYSKVILWVDEETAYAAGDDSGRTLEAELPWATQQLANNVLASIKGFSYQPVTGTETLLDPAAELGDGITIGGVYSPLASASTIFDPLFTSDVSAPHDEEIDHEYPYVAPEKRELNRKVTLNHSYYGTRITRTSGLEIVKTEADGTERSRAVLNSDVQAFYNDDGQEALYFDINAGKFKFRGDVEITGGTMNVNNNFVVDADGNLTLNGKINFSGSDITWGGNEPGNPAEYLSALQITEITKDGVKAAKIQGSEIWGAGIYGGIFSDLTNTSYLKMSTSSIAEGITGATLAHMVPDYSEDRPLMAMGYVEVAGEGYWALLVQGDFVFMKQPNGVIEARGTWDFSKATVTGLSGG